MKLTKQQASAKIEELKKYIAELDKFELPKEKHCYSFDEYEN